MNSKLEPMIEEINNNMITDNRPDKSIYRTKLLEIIHRCLQPKKGNTCSYCGK